NSGEQAAAKSQDAFDLSADSPIFSDAGQFLTWKPESTDEDSPKLKAILIYQQLLQFHAKDDDRAAWLDADLLRLNFGNNMAFGEEKNSRYKAALKRWAEAHADHEISSRAIHDRAMVLHGEGELVDAHQAATQGRNRFPESVGGRRCHNLIAQIEAPSVNITTERVWNNPLPTIDVRYKNLNKVFFRVVKYDWDKRLKSRGNRRPDYLDQNERKALLVEAPVAAWVVDLPTTDDYHDRQESIPARDGLAPGSYFLISSHKEDFGEQNNQVQFCDFWVSDLALVIRSRNGEGVVEGFVLDNETGEPIVEANVRAWRAEQNSWQAAGSTTTNENGFFEIRGVDRKQLVLHASHKGQALSTSNYYYAYTHDVRAKPYSRTMFFTDRSLYRPGQTIQFKGLCINVDAEADSYKTLSNQAVTVVFQDPNGKEIARQSHKSNDYGSFNGSFTAPRDRLMGRMSIRVDGNPQGYSQVTVEEYKRPKFLVKLDAPKEAGRLNGDVSLTGHATAYTGAAIDAAKVKWRVVREVRYPNWFSYRYWWWPQPNNSQEIAHGTSETSVDGSFSVSFNAKPDVTIQESHEPTFHFSIYADVTDTSGETRSADRVIRLGYTALQASLNANSWQTTEKPVEVYVRTSTLDGEGQVAEGTIKVYSLKQSASVQRSPLGGRYMPRFRHGANMVAPAPDPTNVNSWELDEVVAEAKFKTDADGNAKHSFKLGAGPFRVKLATQDRFGKPVTGEFPLQVLDTAATKLAIKLPNVFAAPTFTLEPGEEFKAVWGTGYETARAFIEIEHRRKIVKSFWTDANATQVQINQQVTEAMRGGFIVHVTMVRENRAYATVQKVNVPWSNKN
ncbi:MAG: MG2 domain-containing protein, partial [Planctomycetota bacterium]|nr:MG2 domain-containing protein [Planctomycetota bacterium]